VLAGNVDQTSTITVECTNTTPYNIGLNQGVNGGSVTTRQMKGGPTNQLINYSLSSDAARTVNWGQTIGTDTVAGTGNGSQQAYTVYGRVPPQTTPSPGTYTDTITVTVTY
jgi:spore coat protein U-like protein